MKSPGLRIRPAKARGEWAELRFLTRAIELGFRPTKPWGENSPYDFAVEHNGHFSRVQVKCTCKKRLQSYVCSASNSQGPYSPDQIDFIAAYIIPTDTWYILPVAALHHALRHLANPKPQKLPLRPIPGSLAPAQTLI
jgi:hypothetical protein